MSAPDDADHASDAERHPTLSAHGRAMLQRLREHPHAPRYRDQSGSRLTEADLAAARAFEAEALAAPVAQASVAPPPWLEGFVARCYEQVPFHRRRGSPPARFTDVPTTERADLSHDVAQHVPDDVPVERMFHFRTSGTTGHPLLLPSHPIVAAGYLAYHKRALRRFGITLRAGRGEVGVVLLGFQRDCFTYVSVTPSMGESGLAKINLHPNDWRTPSDRERYLDDLAPEVIAGDPLSFAELLRLPLRCRPRVLLSTAMALSPALAAQLREHFACPVLDLYSLNEAGPVAVHDANAGGHVLLQQRMFVEILDREGHAVPAGTRGEITLTGGFNVYLPLLRYRTGDHAALSVTDGEAVLIGLEGRAPVRFRTCEGRWINNVDVTHCLQRFALAQYSLRQDHSGALQLRCAGAAHDAEAIATALRALFGTAQVLAIEPEAHFDDKVVQYRSELDS